MKTLSLSEAKTKLSALIESVKTTDEEVVRVFTKKPTNFLKRKKPPLIYNLHHPA
jgi:PHD/YefM family antitoxin component YafN of YafNO toxin-antitoxin module